MTNNIENLKLTEIGEKEELLRAEHDHMRNNIDSVMKTISEKLNKGLK